MSNVTTAELVTAATALWGALTGSLALLIQWLQHRQDKVHLTLEPKMTAGESIYGPPENQRLMIDFEVAVVNSGRRIARIEEVGIAVSAKSPSSHGLKMIVYGGKNVPAVSLEEGEKRVFELRRWDGTFNNVAEAMAESETVYVQLTSGKSFTEDFKTVKLSKVEAMRREAREKHEHDK